MVCYSRHHRNDSANLSGRTSCDFPGSRPRMGNVGANPCDARSAIGIDSQQIDSPIALVSVDLWYERGFGSFLVWRPVSWQSILVLLVSTTFHCFLSRAWIDDFDAGND